MRDSGTVYNYLLSRSLRLNSYKLSIFAIKNKINLLHITNNFKIFAIRYIFPFDKLCRMPYSAYYFHTPTIFPIVERLPWYDNAD